MNTSYVGLSRLAMTAINASRQQNSAPPLISRSVPLLPTNVYIAPPLISQSIPLLPTNEYIANTVDSSATDPVYRLSCKSCSTPVCARAWLLEGELTFSTDTPSEGIRVLHDRLLEKNFLGLGCPCIVCEMCCRECGNDLGYHIATLCAKCMEDPYLRQNLWIFDSSGCDSIERRNVNKEIMVRSELPKPEEEHEDYLLGDENPYEQPWR